MSSFSRLFALPLVASLVWSCSDNDPSTDAAVQGPASTAGNSASASRPAEVLATTDDDAASIYLAREAVASSDSAMIDMLNTGVVAVESGCVVLQLDGEESALLVFPPSARLTDDGSTIRVGDMSVAVGDRITVQAAARPSSDFGFLKEEPYPECPNRVIGTSGLAKP